MTEQAKSPPPAHTLRLPFPLQDNETVTALIRRHWYYLWPRTILWVFYALAPVVIGSIVLKWVGVLDDLGIIWWAIVALWLIWWIIRLLLNWYRYHNDIWLITNQRIIDSFKSNPFDLRVATADLVNLQDLSVVKKGIFASMLNFGDIICETAGAGTDEFRITGVPHPESIQLLIDKERDRERGKYTGGPSGTV
jgi:hypothetical protein